ncbi:MAG: sulfatase-like hydrolase/transferase [Rubripirellula sp.]
MKSSLVLLALLLAATGTEKAIAVGSDRPNILYFYVDDMGWGAIGPNGQAERKAKGLAYVQTPNLNRLASQGLNFTRGYGCHVCSPARSSQQTGFHQGHTFADRNDPDNARKAIRAADITMGDALAAADYVTGYWGKWGYGGSKDMQNPTLENLQTLPTSHGYQHVVAELHHVRAHTFFQPTLWTAPAIEGSQGGLLLTPNSMAKYRNNEYPDTPAFQNHPAYPETAYCDDVYAMAALDFVHQGGQNYNQTGQPFFGLLAVQIPHAPFGDIAQLPNWDRAYANSPGFAMLSDQSKQWAAMVTRIDAHFGNILAALEDPNNDGDKSDSVADNTLVIFQSDNGGPAGNSVRELDANGGLKGYKGSIQEGGIRVPLVMRWPAKINESSTLKAGTNTDRIVDVSDLLPTFCELAGQAVPLGIDGVSIAPTLLGIGQQRNRKFIVHEAGDGQSIIQGKYKLVSRGSSNAKKSAKGKGKNSDEPTLSLFDLEADRAESINIAGQHPTLVNELSNLLKGERVYEPKGFANTYHRWTGQDGASASDANNWSDYVYANAGITYMADHGVPQLSWISQVVNEGDRANTIRADADVEFLGLEIRGNSASHATQSVVVSPGVTLTGRNEIHLAAHSDLVVDGGKVSSLRWIDVDADAGLRGSGTIDATVYNRGTVSVTEAKHSGLTILHDFHQTADGTLKIVLGGNDRPAFAVNGVAELGGELSIAIADGQSPTSGDAYPVLVAGQVAGQFANSEGKVVATDGSNFRVHYSKTTVTVVAQ